jgi:hypothetical protein
MKTLLIAIGFLTTSISAQAGFQMFDCRIISGVSVDSYLIVGKNNKGVDTFYGHIYRYPDTKETAVAEMQNFIKSGNCVN